MRMLAPRTIIISPSEVVLAMSASGVADELREVISDESAWRTPWTWVHALMEPEPPLPAVDFGASILLVAATGTRPTGGYAITIDSISQGTTLHAFVTGRVEWVESRRVAPCA
ncbi:MAG TPA: hypothetical protein VFU46_12815 [Gemmatimonadales bacterium]|nr:hypothetical protein [Gemmatimonadales bacterium]